MACFYAMLLSAIAGIAIVQCLPALPPLLWMVCASGLCLAVAIYLYWRSAPLLGRCSASCVALFMLACAFAISQAQTRLDDRLAAAHDDRVSKLTVQVSEMVSYGVDYLQFDATVLSSTPPTGIPKHVRLRWSFGQFGSPYRARQAPEQPMPEIVPGEIWRVSALLRQPYGAINPGQSSVLTHRFANNQRAVGTIRGTPQRLSEAQASSWALRVEGWRHALRKQLQQYVGELRYGAVMIALVIGDQAGIEQEDWQLFNRSGLTHLVSISGTHITMLSALASLFTLLIWRGLSFRGKLVAEYWPAPAVASLVGLAVAWLYCSIAGWGVPAQRTFLMLALFYVHRALGLQWRIHTVLAIAAVIILLLDPWAVLRIGFWLSFGAMLVLVTLVTDVSRVSGWWAKTRQLMRSWACSQGAVFIGLAPLLVAIFGQISLISPVANAYAIFLIGTVVTPLSLALALLSLLPSATAIAHGVAWLAHTVLAFSLDLTERLSTWDYALLDVPHRPLWLVWLSLLAVLALLLPLVTRWCYLGLVWLVVLVFGVAEPKNQLKHGEWRLLAMDVGQGSAILLETASHRLLFDVGPRLSFDYEASHRVILPVLRRLGITYLDTVVVSHSDLDHVGGFSELISHLNVGQVFASFRLDRWVQREEALLNTTYTPKNNDLRADVCYAGQQFEVDGVHFEFIWPRGHTLWPLADKTGNEQSCVLWVRGAYHDVLLTGDVGHPTEQQLLQSHLYAPVDVVVVGHHGAKGSSSQAFVQRLQPQYAIAQAGHYNRFNHPDSAVKRLWQAQGAVFLDTIHEGAIHIHSSAFGLNHHSERQRQRRYWH